MHGPSFMSMLLYLLLQGHKVGFVYSVLPCHCCWHTAYCILAGLVLLWQEGILCMSHACGH